MEADVVGPGFAVIVQRPAAAGPMHGMAPLVVLVRAQSRDPAGVAMLPPEFWVDPAVGIERRDDDVGNGRVAFGVAGLSRELQANLPELRRQ
jgi:hypothetical protein